MTFWIVALELIVLAALAFLFFYIKKKIDAERQDD